MYKLIPNAQRAQTKPKRNIPPPRQQTNKNLNIRAPHTVAPNDPGFGPECCNPQLQSTKIGKSRCSSKLLFILEVKTLRHISMTSCQALAMSHWQGDEINIYGAHTSTCIYIIYIYIHIFTDVSIQIASPCPLVLWITPKNLFQHFQLHQLSQLYRGW